MQPCRKETISNLNLKLKNFKCFGLFCYKIYEFDNKKNVSPFNHIFLKQTLTKLN